MTVPLRVLSPAPADASSTASPQPAIRWVLQAVGWAIDRPWLLGVTVGLIVVWGVGQNLLALWRHQYHATDARLVTIAPPPQVDEHGAAALWANLAGILTSSRRRQLLYGSLHVVLQYAWTGRQLVISLWVPGSVSNGAVEAAVRAAWPGAATSTSEPAPAPIPADTTAAVGGHLLPVAAEWLPFTSDHDADPLRALMAAGAQLRSGEYACVQVLARPAAPAGRDGPGAPPGGYARARPLCRRSTWPGH